MCGTGAGLLASVQLDFECVIHVLIMCIRPDCVLQVLAYWLQALRWVRADQAMSCVVSSARDAIRHVHESGEESAHDEALRMEELGYTESWLQTLLASRGGTAFDPLVREEYWLFYCGKVRLSSLNSR